MKKIPIGIEDFKNIISENYYYIDKTKLIEEIVNDGAKVKLFTRPRRFGKTLNMSTLKYFFDVRNGVENRKLFKNLYIENSPVMEEQGKYPVVFISMKGIASNNFDEALKKIREKISDLFDEYKDILKSLDEFDGQKFKDYIMGNIDKAKLENSLVFLTKILNNHYKEPVVLLIDEYDSIIINAYENGYYKEMINFLKGFYGDVLKTNIYLKFGILTGIVRVAQAGIFSDLNNLIVHTILNKKYEEYFGLLESEVEKILHDYNIEYKIEDVKSWYNGYKFGDKELYNPWSILNYVYYKELKAYWINTSSNLVIKEMLKNSDSKVFKTLEELFAKKDVVVAVSENIALGKNLSSSEIWELLLFSGYLTIKENLGEEEYIVRIPNQEILSFFKKTFLTILFGELQTVNDVKYALFNKDVREIKRVVESLVVNAMSFYDTDQRYENNYQMLLSGFFYALEGIYLVYPNMESGDGRPDIILEPIDKKYPAYIFELKKAISKNVEKESERALNQIEENRYDTILKRKGIEEIVKIGMVFDNKKVEFSYIV